MYITVALYNAINLKKETYYTIQKSHQSPNNLLLLARSTPLQRNDSVLLSYLKRFGGKMGEFDNSVRKT
jgi:hypothetical protein